MPQKPPSLAWISDDDTRRFLVIDEFNVAEMDNLVPRKSLERAARSFRRAAVIVEALTGILLADFLFADETRICVLPARDDSLFPEERSLPNTLLPLIPGVQSWMEAWRVSIMEPSKAHDAELARAKRSLDAKILVRLVDAVLGIANSSFQDLVFGTLDGKRFVLTIPPKQQLLRVKPASPTQPTNRHRIAAIASVTHLINASGSLHSVPTSGVAPGIGAGVIVELLRARPPAQASWLVAASVVRVGGKRKP